MNPQSSKWVVVCAIGLVAAFFMPWFQLLGTGVSGYGLGKLGSYGNYVWIVPVLAGFTVVVTFMRNNNRWMGALTGIVPLGFISYLLVRLGAEAGVDASQGAMNLAGHVFSIGAWLTILFSIGIIASALVGMPPTMNRGLLVTMVVVSGLLVAGAGLAGGTSVQLAKTRAPVQRAWAALDAALQRRNDRIGEWLDTIRSMAPDPVSAALAEAHSKFQSGTAEQGIAAGRAMDAALGDLIAHLEANRQGHPDGRVMQLMDEITGVENALALERSRYNSEVGAFNGRLGRFPTMLFAGMLGFSRLPVYEVARPAPRVSFDVK